MAYQNSRAKQKLMSGHILVGRAQSLAPWAIGHWLSPSAHGNSYPRSTYALGTQGSDLSGKKQFSSFLELISHIGGRG